MEVQILFGSSRLKFILYLSDFILGILIAKRVGEGKVCGLIGLIAEHVLEPEGELILLIDEVIRLGEDASPFLLSVRKNSEYRLQTLPVELCLIVQILECECQLLALGYTFYGEVEPGLIAIVLVRSTIMAYPEQVFVLLASFLDSGEVASAEVAVKSDTCILAFLELLSVALRIKRSQVEMVWVCQWKVRRIFSQLVSGFCFSR